MEARFGVFVAFVAAFLISFGKALQKAASQELPMLSFSSIASYLYHKKWLLGIAGDLCGGALTLVALAHAPISIVQPVMCSGMGMSALIAVYYLHESIAPPDWFSTFLILLGSILVALSHTDHADRHHLFSVPGFLFFSCLVAAFIMFLLSRRRLLKHISPLLAFLDASVPAAAISEHSADDGAGEFFFGGTAGCVFAASSFFVRAATFAPAPMRVAATLLGLCMSVFGVLLQGRGLRDGRSIIIIAWTNAVATMVAMIAGHVVLLEAMPSLTIYIVLRCMAICLILAGIAASALRVEPPTVLVSAALSSRNLLSCVVAALKLKVKSDADASAGGAGSGMTGVHAHESPKE